MSYIIGSIHKITKQYSVAPKPEAHSNFVDADNESRRLAKMHPEKDFIVFKLESIASMPIPEVTVRRL